jgi:cell division protein FtsB
LKNTLQTADRKQGEENAESQERNKKKSEKVKNLKDGQRILGSEKP